MSTEKIGRFPDVSELDAACQALVQMYPVKNWWPAGSRFEIMVGAVLVQNTRWVNVAAAIAELRRAGCLTPDAIHSTTPHRLQKLIRSAGCQRVKARRIKALTTWVIDMGGLRRLVKQPTEALREALLGVHGVGPETADAILCFGFNRRIFIADQYARRWLDRMDLVRMADLNTYELSRRRVESSLNRSTVDLRDLHAAIVLHGQTVCRRQPICIDCPIGPQCRYP